jgi:hypothetical protein
VLKKLYKEFPVFFLLGHLGIGLVYCLYVVLNTNTLGGDTLEHIHSSWLVYANFIPYKDFFQHHNPLLWYLFSPIAGLYAKGIDVNTITDIALVSGVIVSFVTYLYLYLITARFLSTKFAGLLAAAVALTPYVVLSVIHFRPDNFMIASFFAGLYYYFCYLEKQKLRPLILSFLLFWASFMFLQKIIFTLILLGIISLFLLYKRQMKMGDVLFALMLPIALSLFFIVYLYQNGILWTWYQANFLFNLHIPDLFEDRRIGIIWTELKLLLTGAALAVILLSKRSTVYFKIIALIFIVELCQRLTYFSAFAYYFFLLIYISAILSAVFIEKILLKKHFYLIYILLVSLGICMYKPAIYEGNIGEEKGRFYNPLHRKVTKFVTPCDYILNGDGTIYNIFNRDPYYYWNLLGQLDVIGADIGVYPLMDINQVILTYKPKIISVQPYRNKYFSERGQDVIVHMPNMNIINQYYKPLDNDTTLYILKPEYSLLKCDFDYKKRYYNAYD